MRASQTAPRPANPQFYTNKETNAIYFTRPLQEKILADFNNSLNGSGFLFMGKAESIIGLMTGDYFSRYLDSSKNELFGVELRISSRYNVNSVLRFNYFFCKIVYERDLE
jgi:hypothetical protein